MLLKISRTIETADYLLYDLRHSAATFLLLKEFILRLLKSGWGILKLVTLDTYSHVLPTLQKKAAQKIDEVFIGQKSNPNTCMSNSQLVKIDCTNAAQT